MLYGLNDSDTISAIATPTGIGALSIVRISGSETESILKLGFSNFEQITQESQRSYYGYWQNKDVKVDEVVLLYYPAGHGFTGERAAEIICHGGVQVTKLVLNSILEMGARLARPGEFTYRAVMNNRLDLPQAEAVLDIINAKNPIAVRSALKNIRGQLSDCFEKIEAELLFLLAHLEASIDFSTEDIQPVSLDEMRERALTLQQMMDDLLKDYLTAQVVKNGVSVAIIGPPNVGKSSLTNALLGRNRSIVSELPGTTRDTIESDIIIENQNFRLIDTAGIRATIDEIETQGIKRAFDEAECSDLVLYLIDSSIGLTGSDVERIRQLGSSRTIICFNKCDLYDLNVSETLFHFDLKGFETLSVSATKPMGLNRLRALLSQFSGHQNFNEADLVVSNERQRSLLEKAHKNLSACLDLMTENASPELISFELQMSLRNVQELLGKDINDDVMDKVFKEFCIGK